MKNSDSKYLNRELSWLEFNQRVLDEARNPTVPLLERLKFLAITASNLDEFFMVRVGSLQRLVEQGRKSKDPAGMTPRQQLVAIGERARQMIQEQYACLTDDLEPELTQAGMQRLTRTELNPKQTQSLEHLFDTEISAILSPQAVSSAKDFPLLKTRQLNMCVRLTPNEEDEPRFAVIPFTGPVRRFLTVASEGAYTYTLLEEIVELFIDRFFPGDEVVEAVPFRLARDADMSVREDAALDLLHGMEEVLDARKISACVRLEIAERASTPMVNFLQSALAISNKETYKSPGPLDLSAFMQLSDISGFDELLYEAWPSQASPQVDLTASLFDTLSQHDVVLYHPYDSFYPVIRLLEEAADDPEVLAIKQTLYRTSRDSPIVTSLKRAAANGKNVTVIVELKARFDEAQNIEWAKNLEQSGVQVIYGVKGLKTHAKVCIVVRREPYGIQRYVHFSTGNYNEITAKFYGDISYLTADNDLGADATVFFNSITGYSQPQQYRKLDAAPLGMRETIIEMIETETRRKEQGQKASITAKLNSLVDPEIIDALYAASQAGVKIKLNVRGICCLRPGIEGLSENIQVISIVDRYLEHARIFHFRHGGDERVFISSADWMQRNLDRRVELLIPIDNPSCRKQLIAYLDAHFRDNVKARILTADGTYLAMKRKERSKPFRSQLALFEQAKQAVKDAKNSRLAVFEPHRASSGR